jgi:hypothetical protein
MSALRGLPRGRPVPGFRLAEDGFLGLGGGKGCPVAAAQAI